MDSKRRSYLRAVGTLGVTGVTGCLGSGDGNPDVVLAEPERQFESADVPYLAWGQRLPDVTVPAPLEDRQVTLRKFEKPRLLTFFYSNCMTVCPVLVSTMRNVQTHALNNGYGDQVAFLPLTFDPERDDADRLRAYARKMNVDADAGDWHFLRPETEARAKRVIQEDFGVMFQKQSGGTSTATRTESGSTDTATGSESGGDDQYMFAHTALTILANADGYVERAYRTKSPKADRIIGDLATVRKA